VLADERVHCQIGIPHLQYGSEHKIPRESTMPNMCIPVSDGEMSCFIQFCFGDPHLGMAEDETTDKEVFQYADPDEKAA
jgi:hypothetical protein